MNNAFFNNPIVHGIITVLLFILPLIISSGGSWQQITLGGILAAVYKALVNKNSGLTAGGNRRPLI